jgi:hypothetical protein
MKKKLKAALDAIDEIFGDTSVCQQTTLDALEELQSDLDLKIDCIQHDLKVQAREK